MKKTRKLKVSSLYQRRKTIRGYYVPYVRLSGNWLAMAGFDGLRHATVTVLSKGQLLITANPAHL